MGVCKEWGYNGGKERVELWVIKEEQGKKKKIAAAQYWHCAPPQTQARHEKVPDEVT